MSGLVFERGHSDITVDLNEQGLWTITREIESHVAGYDYMGQPVYQQAGPLVMIVDQRQLMSALTPDEAKLLMGYCSHICEHGRMDITTTIHAMIHANAKKDWEQVTHLAETVHASTERLLTAAETGRRLLECHDDVPA